MTKRKENLTLETYYSKFEFKKKNSNLKISFNRIAFIFFIFLFITIIFSSKILYLSKYNLEPNKKIIIESDFRSSILDRNGKIIAKSVITTNVGIDPKQVIDKDKLLINLKLIFPNKNFSEIKKKLNNNNFFYVQKKISSKKYNQLYLLGDKSIIYEKKISRIYPNKELFSHVVGQIDDNNNGISGVEKYFDFELKSKRSPLELTLDSNIQHLIREELISFSRVFNYVGSSAILMNVNNGEVISMLSLPDFNLNERKNLNNLNYINRATKAVYELGSVFKTFTFAAGLNENIIDIKTEFNNLEKQLTCGKNKIGEYDKDIPKDLTAEEILIMSGNVGSVRIAQKIGIEKYKSFLNDLGLLQKIKFDLEEIGTPLEIKWGKCKLATSSFGHGITTTPLQLSKAYAIISNGGYLIKPTILKNSNNNKNFKKILRDGTSEKVNKVLRKIVSTKKGTAGFANVEGFNIGGKTGTAQKTINGKYSDKKVNTFISIFPTSKPKFVLMILLDEPKANQDYIYNYRDGSNFKYKGNFRNTAGWTTAEVAGKIIEKIGPILATKY